MSEPTSILTFEDLLTEIAKEAGIAYYGPNSTSKAMVPIDIHDLELCKDTINKGIRMFMADAPERGWRWRNRIIQVAITGTRVTGTADAANSTSLTDATLIDTYDTVDELVGWYIYVTGGTGEGSWAVITAYDETTGQCTVADWLDPYGNPDGTDPVATDTFAITPVETVAGDIARYPLPENFGGEINGDIHYASDSAHSTAIDWVHESFIRNRRAISVQTGYPRYAAVRPYEPQTNAIDPKRRYELVLGPQPNSTQILEFPYILIFDKLDLESGIADSATTLTLVDGSRLEGDDYFNGWRIKIIDGTGKGSWAYVADYTGSSGTFTVTDWLKTNGDAGGIDPDADSIYIVEPRNNLHPAGAKFDHVIKSACLAQAEQEFENVVGGYVESYIKKDLLKAYQADARSAPKKLGTMNKSERTKRLRIWNDVTTDHDI